MEMPEGHVSSALAPPECMTVSTSEPFALALEGHDSKISTAPRHVTLTRHICQVDAEGSGLIGAHLDWATALLSLQLHPRGRRPPETRTVPEDQVGQKPL